jgi:hypothetical protein
MTRQQDIKNLLRRVAPLFHEIALGAQADAAKFAKTEWAEKYISREASLNQIIGTARWRMVGDRVVLRQGELPDDLEVSTVDEEQNQGRYYLRAPKLGVVATIRRKPHKKDEEPELLQLQIEAAIDAAPVDYGDKTVIYLVVGPQGTEPQFDVVNRGELIDGYKLIDLIEGDEDQAPRTGQPDQLPGGPRPGPEVRSSLDEEDVQEEDAPGAEN